MPATALPVTAHTAPALVDPLQAALQENALLKRQLAQATDELESFTYSVSHDLRASLRHISAFVEIVSEELGPTADAGISRHLATITGAARHMALMIDALMALSQLGRVELNLSCVEVRPLIDEVCAALQCESQAGSDRVQAGPIQWHIADAFPLLHADPVLLRQLLRHLVSNALKFTRPSAGRPLAQVEIGWRWLPDQLCELFVKDNGIGFNPKFVGKLFGVFQRLHSASEFEGIGMGLALSRRIVERHGGSIAASSPASSFADVPASAAGGSELRFTLPVEAAEKSPIS